ncbi:MAG: hypothetical protein PVG70_03305 [Desulfobacterales bacterium]
MNTTKTCLRCGNSSLEPGRVQSTTLLYFRLANPRIMTVRTADIPLQASMCLDCGTIDFGGEVKKARKLSKQT